LANKFNKSWDFTSLVMIEVLSIASLRFSIIFIIMKPLKYFISIFRLLSKVCLILIAVNTCYSAKSQSKSEELNNKIRKEADKSIIEYQPLYIDLHQNPELSGMEARTSEKMSASLKKLGFDVTTGIGGYGVAGVYKNGKGPVIMLRTDMDALPVRENTGLPYASTRTMQNEKGELCPVMHACGHDLHMTVWLGTLSALISLRNEWSGTLLAVAQPAEETGSGSLKMLNDGLFERFPGPDMAFSFHVSPEIPAGQIGYLAGPIFAGVASIDLTVHGIGGHGAMPYKTIDPVVLAAETIMGIQTIISRQINPVDPAVITVGSIHGGTRYNIIPDEVKMQLTVRFFKQEVYQQIIKSLKTLTTGIALSAGVPQDKLPEIEIGEATLEPVINNPGLTGSAVRHMQSILGEENLQMVGPTMTGEDFGRYGLTKEKTPIALFWLGGVNKEKYNEYTKLGKLLPSLHNPEFNPDFVTTFETGVCAMTKTVIEIMNNGSNIAK